MKGLGHRLCESQCSRTVVTVGFSVPNAGHYWLPCLSPSLGACILITYLPSIIPQMIWDGCLSARGLLGDLKDTEESPELWNFKGEFPNEEHQSFARPLGILPCLFI